MINYEIVDLHAIARCVPEIIEKFFKVVLFYRIYHDRFFIFY